MVVMSWFARCRRQLTWSNWAQVVAERRHKDAGRERLLDGRKAFPSAPTRPMGPGRVQNPCPESTSHNQPSHKALRRPLHGTPARLRLCLPPATSNPSPRSKLSSAPAAIGRSPRLLAATPPARGQLLDQLRPRRHPGRLETGLPRPLPAASSRHRHQPGRARHRVSQPPGGNRDHHPGGELVSISMRSWPSSNATSSANEPLRGWPPPEPAAAAAAGSVLTVARVR
jgi:hypothetical protein